MASASWKACTVSAAIAVSPAGLSKQPSMKLYDSVLLSAELVHPVGCRKSIFAQDQTAMYSRKLTSTSALNARRRASNNVYQISCEQPIEELPSKLQDIVKGFQSVPDPRARYQQLLHYAAKLKPLPKEYHTVENKVTGCVSQVWVLPTIAEDGKVYFQADSDSALTKGLAALLVEGFSGSPPSAILTVTPDFIQQLGLKQSLTPSRNNGFLNMLKLMQKKTLELYVKAEKQRSREAAKSGSDASPSPEGNSSEHATLPTVEGGPAESGASSAVHAAEAGSGESVATASTNGRPIYDAINAKLTEELGATEVVVEDVSHQHAGHAGIHRGASETHFNVRVVSPKFDGLSTIKRHRLVYNVLTEEFSNGLHALSLVTKSPAEMQKV